MCTVSMKRMGANRQGKQKQLKNTYPIPCEYHIVGCKDKIPRNFQIKHNQKNMKKHFILVSGCSKELNDTKTQLKNTKDELNDAKNNLKKSSMIPKNSLKMQKMSLMIPKNNLKMQKIS